MGVSFVKATGAAERKDEGKAEPMMSCSVLDERYRGSHDGLASNLGASFGMEKLLRQWNWTTPRCLYTGIDAWTQRALSSPEAARMQADGLTKGRLKERGRLGWLALSHHASNHQTTDHQTAAVPSLRCPPPARLSNCGCQLGSELPLSAQSGSAMGPTGPGQPITACQMWQHQRSPTSNHSPAAFQR